MKVDAEDCAPTIATKTTDLVENEVTAMGGTGERATWIPWARPEFWGKEKEYVLDALQSTWISGGEYVDRLEQHFITRFRVPHALTVANGTASLHMAYLALGIQAGDELVLPGFAFLAAANVALHM